MPYRGIYNLRAADEEVKLTEDQTSILKKCAADPEYFIFNYVYTNTKDAGMHILYDRPRQRAEIATLQVERFVKGDWYRQSGFTTIVLSYLLWKAIFTPDLIITYCTGKKDWAYEQFQLHIRDAIMGLPNWLQPGVKEWTRHTVRLANGSVLMAGTADSGLISGVTNDYIFVDNFGWLSDSRMMKLVDTAFVGAKNWVRTHLILGAAELFGKHTEANTLYWENCDIPFVHSVYRWEAHTDEDRQFEKDMRGRIGDRAFEREYLGKSGKEEKETPKWASKIDSIGDPIRKTRWRASVHSAKPDWKWLIDHIAVFGMEHSKVSVGGREYPGLDLRCVNYEGHPVESLDLEGFVDVDAEFFTWNLGEDAGKVRYRCLCLPSLVETDRLLYEADDKRPLMSTVRLVVVGKGGDGVPRGDIRDVRGYHGMSGVGAVSAWLADNVEL